MKFTLTLFTLSLLLGHLITDSIFDIALMKAKYITNVQDTQLLDAAQSFQYTAHNSHLIPITIPLEMAILLFGIMRECFSGIKHAFIMLLMFLAAAPYFLFKLEDVEKESITIKDDYNRLEECLLEIAFGHFLLMGIVVSALIIKIIASSLPEKEKVKEE